MQNTTSSTDRRTAAVEAIRRAIRAEKPYIVGSGPEPEVKLNQNESPYDLPSELKSELVERFLSIPLNRYPKEQPWALRDALAETLGLPPDYILVGNGSNELSHTLVLATVEPDTPVVLPRPMFSLYASVVRMHGGRPIQVAPRDDFSFDVEGLHAAIRREQPPLIILTSPNNPTGLAMPIGDIESLVAAAPGLAVVDEAYWEFNDEPPATTLLDEHPNLVIVRTFSKAMGLAGSRIGYLIAHPDVIAELMKSRLPFMVDRFAEEIALAVLRRPELIRRQLDAIRAGRNELKSMLDEMDGVEYVPTAANFFLFTSGANSRLLLEQMAAEGVLVRNMSGYPELEGYLRVNAGTPAENKAFQLALKRTLG